MNGPLKLGTAKLDITPPKPIPLAGFAHRQGNYDDIARRLYVRVWYFQQLDAQGQPHQALLVQADIIWWGSERMEAIYALLEKRWGLKREEVILHASHTHGGPQTSDLFMSALGTMDLSYVEWMEEQLMAGIEQAYANLEPVSLERGSGACQIGIHRRKEIEGSIRMAPHPEGPIDTEVTVIRYRNEDGAVRGVMFHYTCHSTTTGDNRVTSEYPGAAMENVERELGEGVIASFLQGCCGDIRPALIREGAFYSGTEEDVGRLGQQLSDQVIEVLSRPMSRVPSAGLASHRQAVELSFRKLPSVEELQDRSGAEGVAGEWSRLLMNHPERNRPSIPLTMNIIRIADGLAFLAMDGEIVVEYGMFIKKISEGSVLPLAYSNGMIGYVPTARQVEEGGYEGGDSAVYFGLPSAFEPALEDQIKAAAVNLVNEVRA
ncbi:neutral/alkaline non-lysosomal ceramidase N-terminal domain-containing protein [Paenibacillus sp. J2TS4]|uniref:neutral/alkaline non-lysosomal ceramidase N-terminal domain-containing protein n=1 Tax=Paenibacillus sp. J2TS4 TaxID=2807194 RepID=UPI001B24427F|nr:neutral/alkaline non-lysosomal ceramidase N-terminal domain-containing protein [Paenibacillus sp. J2TS4]GIP32939.1 alkaline ceramidase [Paenibacillus sp. J2TS4]